MLHQVSKYKILTRRYNLVKQFLFCYLLAELIQNLSISLTADAIISMTIISNCLEYVLVIYALTKMPFYICDISSWHLTINHFSTLAWNDVHRSSQTVVCFRKSREQELTQNLIPVGFGPSSNTWPRWDLHSRHLTSILWRPDQI